MSFYWSSGCYNDNLLIFWQIYEFFKGFSLYNFLLCFWFFFCCCSSLNLKSISSLRRHSLSECTDCYLTFQQVLKKAIKKSNILWLTLIPWNFLNSLDLLPDMVLFVCVWVCVCVCACACACACVCICVS